MKTIPGDQNRLANSQVVYTSGKFSYRLDFLWAKWPEGMKNGIHTLGAYCDKDDNLYVGTEDENNPIVVFDKDGNFVRSFAKGLFKKTHSLFLTKNNTLICADSSPNFHVIREVSLTGELVRDFGTLGKPGDSGYDRNYLETLKKEGKVPTDPEWNKRAEFNARLDSIRRRGGPFCIPCAMVVAESGEMFAADGYGNAAVHKFAADGTLLKSWGAPGNGPGEFRLPHDVEIDKLGRVWIADRENSRAQVFSQDGELLAIIEGGFYDIASLWTDGTYMYMGELLGGLVIVDMDLNIVAELGFYDSPLHAHGLTGDSKGNLFVLSNKFIADAKICGSNILKLTRL